MALTDTPRRPETNLDAGRMFIKQKQKVILDAWATWKLYRRTYHELQSLSDRELGDLGIVRNSIAQIAKDAVTGA